MDERGRGNNAGTWPAVIAAVPGSEPFPGAGEQMRWSDWQAGTLGDSGTDWPGWLTWAYWVPTWVQNVISSPASRE